ncbi:MAG: ABC transporter substrate-binding protein, partial [Burkholderiales bacterium]
KAMVRELRKANFKSVRGDFKYNTNHHPIQDFYLLKAVKDAKAPEGVAMHIEKKVFDNHKDAYYQECKMKW